MQCTVNLRLHLHFNIKLILIILFLIKYLNFKLKGKTYTNFFVILRVLKKEKKERFYK